MIIFGNVSPQTLSLFGERAGTGTAVFAVSRKLGDLYHWNADRHLRADLGCTAKAPADGSALRQLQNDINAFAGQASDVAGGGRKIHFLREFFVVRDVFEGLGDGPTVSRIDSEFLNPMCRSVAARFFSNETLASLGQDLDEALRDDRFEAYGLLKTFVRWRRFNSGLVDALLGDLGDVADRCAAAANTLLGDLADISGIHVAVSRRVVREGTFAEEEVAFLGRFQKPVTGF